ncbi:hypothetical protein PSPO01_09720 [Paraphaeosphaeria sporulosa]
MVQSSIGVDRASRQARMLEIVLKFDTKTSTAK